jgi:hypothetical protein
MRWKLPTIDVALAVVGPLGCGLLLLEAAARTSHRDAQPSEQCACAATTALVTAAHVRLLEAEGLVSIPLALRGEALEGARADAWAVCASGRLSASDNDLDTRQDQVVMLRESDGTASVRSRSGRGHIPLGADLLRAIRLTRGVSHALAVHGYGDGGGAGGTLPTSRSVPLQVQLARYVPGGGASYRRHLDSCNEGVRSLGLLEWLRLSDYRERKLTVILYLNSPRWGDEQHQPSGVSADVAGCALRPDGREGVRAQPLPSRLSEGAVDGAAENGGGDAAPCGSGGELRWYHTDGSGGWSEIAPRGGTLVIFDSTRVEHEVVPSSGADRYAITSWVSRGGRSALASGQ